MKKSDLVKLSDSQLQELSKGELIFITHPKKGMCKVDATNVFVKVF